MATIHAGLQTGFQALIDAVERGDDLASLQKKQRGILMLTEMARQLNVLDQERADSLRVLEQLDIQNTIATVGRLLKLQHQLNDVVVKDLTAQLENTILTVTHLEDTCFKKAIADQETLYLLQLQSLEMRELLGVFRGKYHWEKYFGTIGAIPPLPLDFLKILESPCPFWPGKRVQETHVLTLIPATVNGQPLTINTFENLMQNPKQGNKTKFSFDEQGIRKEFENIPVKQSHWVLMPRFVISQSRNKIYADQLELAAQYPHYQVAGLLEAAVCIVMEFMVSGICLYGPNDLLACSDFIRCKESVVQGCEYQISLGGFNPDQLTLISYIHNSSLYGLYDQCGIGLLRRWF